MVVALALVMDLMDATILTIALRAIQRTMHARFTAVHWMAAAYTLTFALLLVTGGRLGDVLGSTSSPPPPATATPSAPPPSCRSHCWPPARS